MSIPKFLFIVLILLVFETGVATLLLSPNWIDYTISQEQDNIHESMGVTAKEWVEVKTFQSYQYWIIETGFRDSIINWLTFTDQRRAIAPELDKLASTVGQFTTPRVYNFFDYLFVITMRAWVYIAWLPLFLVMVLPIATDAWTVWKVRQHSYDFASPVSHRVALWVMIIVVFISLGILLSPVPIPSVTYPIIMVVLVGATYFLLINTQKRI